MTPMEQPSPNPWIISVTAIIFSAGAGVASIVSLLQGWPELGVGLIIVMVLGIVISFCFWYGPGFIKTYSGLQALAEHTPDLLEIVKNADKILELTEHLRPILTLSDQAGKLQEAVAAQTNPENVDQLRLLDVFPELNRVFRAVDLAFKEAVLMDEIEVNELTANILIDVMAFIPGLFRRYSKHVHAVVTVKIRDPIDEKLFRTIHMKDVDPQRRRSEPAKFPLKGSIAGRIFEEKKPLVIPDLANREAFQENELDSKPWPDRTKYIKSVVGAPVFVDNNVFAVLVVDSDQPNVFRRTVATYQLIELCAAAVSMIFAYGKFLKDKGIEVIPPGGGRQKNKSTPPGGSKRAAKQSFHEEQK